ncbi:hypothetical protein XFEB_02204 [Xylella fastidiosa EB92.1]|nr:hypothetical protein XFEB_02204 [Xylella fastidiosa EB92.1]
MLRNVSANSFSGESAGTCRLMISVAIHGFNLSRSAPGFAYQHWAALSQSTALLAFGSFPPIYLTGCHRNEAGCRNAFGF